MGGLKMEGILKWEGGGLKLQQLQWSLYFKTTCGTKKMWSYIAGGLKKGNLTKKIAFWEQIKWSYN